MDSAESLFAMLQRSLIALNGEETDWRHAATQVCVGTVSDDEPESREATGEGSALDGTRSPWSTAQSSWPPGRISGNGEVGAMEEGSRRCRSKARRQDVTTDDVNRRHFHSAAKEVLARRSVLR